jgi:hypothetical protein
VNALVGLRAPGAIIAVFSLTLCAEVDTIAIDALETMNQAYIYEMLQGCPSLQVVRHDATDFGGIADRSYSLADNGTLLAHNGLVLGTFHDGIAWFENRNFSNRTIARIEVRTGIDTYPICAGCDAVVNVITRPIASGHAPAQDSTRPVHFYARSYVGSEIGDPTILLYTLPPEQVPENKEQVGVGEVAVSLRSPHSSHSLAVQPTYTDRYSHDYESQRAGAFPIRNQQSLDEHRTVTLMNEFAFQSWHLGVQSAIVDYNSFRYRHDLQQYYHYDGTRAVVQGALTTPLFGGMVQCAAAGWYDQALITIGEPQGMVGRMGGGTLAATYHQTLSSRFSVELSTRSIAEMRSAQSKDFWFAGGRSEHITQLAQPIISLSGIDTLGYFNAALDYPLGFRCWGRVKPGAYGGFIWGGGGHLTVDKSDNISRFDATAGWENEWKHDYTTSITVSGKLSTDTTTGRLMPVWSINGSGCLGNTGTFFVHLSPYTNRCGWKRNIEWNRMSMNIGLYYYSASRWDMEARNLLPIWENSGYRLPDYLLGMLSASYGLFNDHIRLTLMLQDLGEKHKETPWGERIGPLIVTSLRLLF